MSQRRKALVGKAGEWLLRTLRRRLVGRPDEVIEATGRRWGRILQRVGRRTGVADRNLAMVFPEWSAEDRARVIREVYEHFGTVSADFLAYAERPLPELEQKITVVGREHLEAALAEARGVLLATGHLGHWERMAAWLSRSGYPLNVVIRSADTGGVDRIINDLRRASGTTIIPRGEATRPILDALKANQIVGILSDQNDSSAFVPFFGHPAGTNLGLGVIHERTRAPILPAVCWRTGVGQYEIHFFTPLMVTPEGEKGVATMQAVHAWLEEQIRTRPAQWLWIHDRWRAARRKGLL